MIIKDASLPQEIKQAIIDDNASMVIDFAQSFEKTGGWHGITLVNLASKTGSMNTLKALMNHYPNGSWNVYTFDLKDIIQYGIQSDNALEVVDFLFEQIEQRKIKEKEQKVYHPCDINSYRNSILTLSVQKNKLELTAYLLDRGADINLLHNWDDKTPELDIWLSKYILNQDLHKKLSVKNNDKQKIKI